jgi:hypothetical protein
MAHGRCGADAMPINALLSLALPAKVADRVLALLPQKRNFRFLFLNQCKRSYLRK